MIIVWILGGLLLVSLVVNVLTTRAYRTLVSSIASRKQTEEPKASNAREHWMVLIQTSLALNGLKPAKPLKKNGKPQFLRWKSGDIQLAQCLTSGNYSLYVKGMRHWIDFGHSHSSGVQRLVEQAEIENARDRVLGTYSGSDTSTKA